MTTIADKHQMRWHVANAIFEMGGKLIAGYEPANTKRQNTAMSNYEDPREPGDPPEISPIVIWGCAFVVFAGLLWLLLTFGPLWWGK